MKKVFLYLYPVQEYNRYFEFSEEYLHEIGRENPYKVLNECIQKRYREKHALELSARRRERYWKKKEEELRHV